jgi:hypothetical protein
MRKDPRTASLRVIEYIYQRDGKRCSYCGRRKSKKDLRIDHIVPFVSGGKTEISNLAVACHDCNAAKRDNSLKEFCRIVNRYSIGSRHYHLIKKYFVDAMPRRFKKIMATEPNQFAARLDRREYKRIHKNLLYSIEHDNHEILSLLLLRRNEMSIPKRLNGKVRIILEIYKKMRRINNAWSRKYST